MKLVVFGLSISSSWGNGHATLWRGLCRALAARGHDIVFFERDVPYYAAHRDLVSPPWATHLLYPDWEDVQPRAAQEVADADAAIITSYCADAAAATALALDAGAPLTVFYDLDTGPTLDAVRAGRAVSYLGPQGLRDYDLVLSYVGGGALDELRDRLGARQVAPLYGSVDPEVHFPLAPVADYAADLSYLGTYAADRQEALETLFLEPARRRPDRRFLIGGAQYPQDFPWTDNLYFRPHVAPDEHPAFYCSSPLTLNVTRRPMAELGYCPSGRLFEAAACGVPLLSDSWAGLEQFFTPDEEILIARSTDDTLAALDRSPEELAALGRRARARTLDEHTAAHRAAELERILDAALASRSPAPDDALAGATEE